jgi:tRNA modification GTPase
MKKDTIAAIATAVSESGIGIIRVSGEEAVEVVDSIFRTKSGKSILKNMESHTIRYGFIYDGDEMIDEVMVSFMKNPRSFTKEDTVEINCHGGILVMNKVLETVIKNGARLAEPGEFTKRAFLNGRIDLSKAEAIMDLIHAKNEFARKNSVNQLKGSVSSIIRELRAKIIYEIAFIESALDDPEHFDTTNYPQKLSHIVNNLLAEINHLLDTCEDGKILKEGIHTVIVGKPNAGKSSLLNLLLGEERAIVTDVAGTTRDILEESIRIKGIHLNIIDTAGIRFTEDIVEKIGVDKAKKYASDADLIIYVVDTSVDLDEADKDIMKLLINKKSVILCNKADLASKTDEQMIMNQLSLIFKESGYHLEDSIRIIKTSTKENTGISEFEDAIAEMFFHGDLQFNDEVYITNMRHKEALLEAKQSLQMVKQSLMDNMPEDFYSIDLMNAYTSLGFIIGEELGDDLVQEIFSKFCMGK